MHLALKQNKIQVEGAAQFILKKQMRPEFSLNFFCSLLCMLWLWLILTSTFPHVSLLLMVTSSQCWVHNFFWRRFISKVIHLREKSDDFPFFFLLILSILKVQADGYANTDVNLLHTSVNHESQ